MGTNFQHSGSPINVIASFLSYFKNKYILSQIKKKNFRKENNQNTFFMS